MCMSVFRLLASSRVQKVPSHFHCAACCDVAREGLSCHRAWGSGTSPSRYSAPTCSPPPPPRPRRPRRSPSCPSGPSARAPIQQARSPRSPGASRAIVNRCSRPGWSRRSSPRRDDPPGPRHLLLRTTRVRCDPKLSYEKRVADMIHRSEPSFISLPFHCLSLPFDYLSFHCFSMAIHFLSVTFSLPFLVLPLSFP